MDWFMKPAAHSTQLCHPPAAVLNGQEAASFAVLEVYSPFPPTKSQPSDSFEQLPNNASAPQMTDLYSVFWAVLKHPALLLFDALLISHLETLTYFSNPGGPQSFSLCKQTSAQFCSCNYMNY